MPDPRLLAIITALTLFSGSGAVMGQESLAKLQQLEQLIVSKDCGGMRNFINANPELSRGSDPLAVELRAYATRLNSGLIQCLESPRRARGSNRTARESITRNASQSAIY